MGRFHPFAVQYAAVRVEKRRRYFRSAKIDSYYVLI
jgi:hypothetical protein